MRTIVAVVMSTTFLFIGGYAISYQAQETQPTLNSTRANETFNVSLDVFEGVTSAGGMGIVWFGVAAVLLVALGFLVVAAQSGGR